MIQCMFYLAVWSHTVCVRLKFSKQIGWLNAFKCEVKHFRLRFDMTRWSFRCLAEWLACEKYIEFGHFDSQLEWNHTISIEWSRSDRLGHTSIYSSKYSLLLNYIWVFRPDGILSTFPFLDFSIKFYSIKSIHEAILSLDSSCRMWPFNPSWPFEVLNDRL